MKISNECIRKSAHSLYLVAVPVVIVVVGSEELVHKKKVSHRAFLFHSVFPFHSILLLYPIVLSLLTLCLFWQRKSGDGLFGIALFQCVLHSWTAIDELNGNVILNFHQSEYHFFDSGEFL